MQFSLDLMPDKSVLADIDPWVDMQHLESTLMEEGWLSSPGTTKEIAANHRSQAREKVG
ncbi:MAG: hypothetical protein R3C56_03710 [Pirellulaceae bacterium]